MGHFIWMKSVFGWMCVCKSRKHLHSQNGVCCVIVCYSSVLFWFKFEICIPILLSNRRWFDCKQRQKHSTNCSKQKQQRADTSVDTHTTHTHTRARMTKVEQVYRWAVFVVVYVLQVNTQWLWFNDMWWFVNNMIINCRQHWKLFRCCLFLFPSFCCGVLWFGVPVKTITNFIPVDNKYNYFWIFTKTKNRQKHGKIADLPTIF